MKIYKQCVGIDRQSYPHQREDYGTTYKKKLNYEAINNNNKIIPKHQKAMYDYKVRNHVDFSNLFLATNMAIYTASRVGVGMIACRFQRIACIFSL
jgi:hypothetical protein